jgi:hypothetical protein
MKGKSRIDDCWRRTVTTAQLRKQVIGQVKVLSDDGLRVACHFIEYLNEHEDDATTAELLKIKGFQAALRRAERQVAKGQTVRFAKVRRDV